MSITFACGNCGKLFTVEDKFAGKKGRCKKCGAVMPIPQVTELRAGPLPLESDLSSSRGPYATAGPPSEELYVLDDIPTSPRESLPVRLEEMEPGPLRLNLRSDKIPGSPRTKKKSPGGSGVPKLAIRIAIGGVLALGGMGGAGAIVMNLMAVSSRDVLESTLQERIDLNRQLATTISGVNDVRSARAASPQAVAMIKAITANLRKLKASKVTKADLDALKHRYQVPQEFASQKAVLEISRVASIPGAWDVLNLQGALEELDNEERSIPGIRQIQAPTILPPATVVPPPVVNPGVRPGLDPFTRPGPNPIGPKGDRPKPGTRRRINRPNPAPG